MWQRFQQEFNRNSATDEQFQAFKENVLNAHAMNLEQGINCTDLFDGEECVFGVTKFSDMSEDEFAGKYLGYKRQGNHSDVTVEHIDLSQQPESVVDWRKKGAVTKVKDQGDCGSCWAFSTTEEVESAAFMSTGKLRELSTQQIISCDKTDSGCDGGDTITAYKYLEKAGGLVAAADYPDVSHTTGETGKCKLHSKPVVKVKTYSYAVKPCDKGSCKHQDEKTLARALASKGPISICVNAGSNAWQSYKKGVFSRKCSGAADSLDHCVQLVGYNMQDAKNSYWIVRNSWNTDWGVDGFMYLKMGKNLCGVADEATIATTAAADDEGDVLLV